MATVFLNGSFLDPADARVSAFDAGFQHGVGLFETMLAVRDPAGLVHVVHLQEHLSRLAASAKVLNLSRSLRTAALGQAVERCAARAGADSPNVSRFRIRLTLTGGDMSMLGLARGQAGGEEPVHTPTLMIHAQPAALYPREMFTQGVMVAIADWKANPLDPFQGHKTLWYWPRLRELQIAAAKRAGEALILQVTNHVAGGCVSNLFAVRGQTLLTPIARGEEEDALGEVVDQALDRADISRSDDYDLDESSADNDDQDNLSGRGRSKHANRAMGDQAEPDMETTNNQYDPLVRGAAIPSPVLPGVVRRWVMDWALSRGIACERRLVTIADVLDADELFLTNTGWGVLPVVAVENKVIGDGLVGPTTTALVEAWAAIGTP